MTNERAVEILNLDLDILGQYECETAEAYKLAIQALEAQPCEDCISRQAALDCFEQTNTRQGAKYAIETLPPVKPKYTDEEIDKIQEIEQAYVDKMVELAVEETRPKGKWIFCYGNRGKDNVEKCSCCKSYWKEAVIYRYDTQEYLRLRLKYCPKCGAEMEGEEDV